MDNTKKLLENIFLMDDEEMNLLYDDHYDVKVFLQRQTNTAPNETGLQPADICRFDIGQKIIRFLAKESNKFLRKDQNDFYTDYEAVSDQIQAKYFLTRFHSNHAWAFMPICIFRLRISAFILPGTAPTPEDTTGVNVTTDSIDGAKYRIDSIHFNSDICRNLEEFEDFETGGRCFCLLRKNKDKSSVPLSSKDKSNVPLSSTCAGVCVNVDNVLKEIDDLAEAIHKTTYDEDFGYVWKYLQEKRSKESNIETSADSAENTANAMNKLMDGIKKAADKSLNKDPGRKVRRYTGDEDVNDTQMQENGENSVLEILNKEYDIAPEEVKGYEKIEKEKVADVKKCKLYRFTVILKKEAYTINADGEPEMTCRAQKEYDDFVFKIRNDSIRDYIEIVEEGYGENEDELEWHVTGCVRNKTEKDSIAAIVAFEVCVRTEE